MNFTVRMQHDEMETSLIVIKAFHVSIEKEAILFSGCSFYLCCRYFVGSFSCAL